MAERRRNLVRRADGTLVNVARARGQLLVCASGCCCGRTEDGFPPVPADLYHREWERRRLRNLVHLTIGGCLGPCALANVALLLFDGRAFWFHSVNDATTVLALYDHIEALLEADECAPLPAALAPLAFTASTWQPRPDGQHVDDFRPRRRLDVAPALGTAGAPLLGPAGRGPGEAEGPAPAPGVDSPLAARLAGELGGSAAPPRRNGELVFEAPWQGRVFGMAVALSEQGLYPWEDFRQALIAEIAAAEARGGAFRYYDCWLAAFERTLAARGVLAPADVEEVAFQHEFGERDDVTF